MRGTSTSSSSTSNSTATAKRDAISNTSGGGGGVLMDFPGDDATTSKRMAVTSAAPAHNQNQLDHELRSVGSASSLSSTVYDDELDGAIASSSGLVTSDDKLLNNNDRSFESSAFFRFAVFGGDATTDDDVLPPTSSRTVSPSNQTTHDLHVGDINDDDDVQPTAAAPVRIKAPVASRAAPPLSQRSVSLGTGGRPGSQNQRIHHQPTSRRKNSIEMFLSQSPSQALGGGFLKMALDDDHHLHQHQHHTPETVTSGLVPTHRLPPRRHDAGVAGAAGGGRSVVVAISQQPQPSHSHSPELEMDAPLQAHKETAPLTSHGLSHGHSRSHSHQSLHSHHGTTGYLHSPPAVDTDDEWSSTSSQEMLSGSGPSSAAAAAYYYEQQQLQQQHVQQQQQQQHQQQHHPQHAYGSNYRSTSNSGTSNYAAGSSDAYATSGRAAGSQHPYPYQKQHQQPHQSSSWHASGRQSPYSSTNSSLTTSPMPSPYAMSASSGFGPQPQQAYQQSATPNMAPSLYQQQQQQQHHQQQQQHHHHQQLYGPSPHHHHPPQQRGSRNYGRSQSMYTASPSASGRMMMMMESSPPPSPHSGPVFSVKQCKFFQQGHCRMGSKCKFAHLSHTHASSPAPSYHEHQPSQHQSQHQYPQPPTQLPRLHPSQSQPSFHVGHASPATSPLHHHHHHQQQPRTDYDAMAPTPSSYLPRGGSGRSSSSRTGGPGSGRGGADLYPQQSSSSSMGGGVALPSPHHHQRHHQQHQQQQHTNSSLPGGPASSSSSSQTGAADALLKIEVVHGRVFSMSKDQNGCRLLQEQLEYYDERKALCDVIYSEAMDHLAEMMVDPFGNYLFQKLLERARPLQRLEIVRRVGAHLVAAALNLHGTRSVQKVVEVCATSAQVVELDSDGNELRRVNLPDLIVAALQDDAVRLCIDSNGNHVIQRALQFMKPQYNQFVFDAVAKECTTVGTHRHGCCVLQRCLDAANDTQKREVIAQVEKQAMKLMQDPYGNYVVQYVLDSCTAEEAYGVIVKPLGSVFELSIQKFSSNVIEKCLEKAPPAVLVQYVDEITSCPKMQKMLSDQFANYVVQRALCVATEDQCLTLVKAIRPHLPGMKNTSGGRRITARILKRFPHMDLNLDLGFEPVGPGGTMGMGGYGGIGMDMGSMGMGMGMDMPYDHSYQTQTQTQTQGPASMPQQQPEPYYQQQQYHHHQPLHQQPQQSQYTSTSGYGLMSDHGAAFAAPGGLGLHGRSTTSTSASGGDSGRL